MVSPGSPCEKSSSPKAVRMRRWVSARCSALLAAEILGMQTLYRDVSVKELNRAAVRAERVSFRGIDQDQGVGVLPCLVKGSGERLRGLGAGQSELPVEHEERDAAD